MQKKTIKGNITKTITEHIRWNKSGLMKLVHSFIVKLLNKITLLTETNGLAACCPEL